MTQNIRGARPYREPVRLPQIGSRSRTTRAQPRARSDLHIEAINPTAHQQTFFQRFLTKRAIGIETNPAATFARLDCNLDLLLSFGHNQIPLRADSTLCFPLGNNATILRLPPPANNDTGVPVRRYGAGARASCPHAVGEAIGPPDGSRWGWEDIALPYGRPSTDADSVLGRRG